MEGRRLGACAAWQTPELFFSLSPLPLCRQSSRSWFYKLEEETWAVRIHSHTIGTYVPVSAGLGILATTTTARDPAWDQKIDQKWQAQCCKACKAGWQL